MMTTYSYLVAVSADKGKTWLFIDASDRSTHEIKKAFPFLNPKLVLPESKEPEFDNKE